MALIFDKNGKLIHDVISYKTKHDELTNDSINDVLDKTIDKYFCSKCETYHKRIYRGKLNFTFIKHHFFLVEVSDSYIYNKKLSKSFRNYDIKKHKLSKGSKKQ